MSYPQPHNAGYPQYGAPQQQYGGAPAYSQGYQQPQQQYDATQPQYGAPQQQYGAPQQQYGAPQQQYGAPQQQYGAPQYGTPTQQHGAPQHTQYGNQQYGAPTTYSQPPQQGYAAAPAGQHVIVGPQFLVQGQQPTVLILKEKLISMGTDSTITNSNGQVMFKFDGKALSMKDKRVLYDANGQLLVTMTQKMFSKHHTWLVSRGTGGGELCTIQQDDAGSIGGANIYLPGKPRFGVSTADYIVRVQAGGKDFQVQTKSGQLLAETSRSNQWMGSMMGADRYGIVIQPGVDMAFIVCVCTAMDDMAFY